MPKPIKWQSLNVRLFKHYHKHSIRCKSKIEDVMDICISLKLTSRRKTRRKILTELFTLFTPYLTRLCSIISKLVLLLRTRICFHFT